jgi:hypothetical protein
MNINAKQIGITNLYKLELSAKNSLKTRYLRTNLNHKNYIDECYS